MSASLTTRINYTASPRSAVVHVINGGATVNYSHETICGREIRGDWAGEYNQAPQGPATCKRCKIVADEIDAENAAILAAAAVYPVGARVGILVGHQSVDGPHVGTYGNVTEIEEYWNGTISYVVISDEDVANGDADGFVYEAWQLVADETPDNDAETDDRQARGEVDAARAELANADADKFFADVTELLSGNPWAFVPCEEDCDDSRCQDYRADRRAAAMAAHPAGKARPVKIGGNYPHNVSTGRWVDSVGTVYQEGTCDWDCATALVTRVSLGANGNAWVCSSHIHLV